MTEAKHTYHAACGSIYRDKRWFASTQQETGTETSGAERALAREVAIMLDSHADLLEACKAALPWVACCFAGQDEDRHPQSIANQAEDLAMLKAAIAKAESKV